MLCHDSQEDLLQWFVLCCSAQFYPYVIVRVVVHGSMSPWVRESMTPMVCASWDLLVLPEVLKVLGESCLICLIFLPSPSSLHFLPNMATSQLQPEFTVVGAQATRTAHCRGQVFSPWNDHKFLTCVYATTQVCDDRIYALDTQIQHAGSWIKRQVKDMDSAKWASQVLQVYRHAPHMQPRNHELPREVEGLVHCLFQSSFINLHKSAWMTDSTHRLHLALV